MEGFKFGRPIFGGAHTWRSLFSEFCGTVFIQERYTHFHFEYSETAIVCSLSKQR